MASWWVLVIIAGVIAGGLVAWAYLGVKELCLVAALGTLAAVSRVPFVILPGVQPATFLVVTTGWVFGPQAGFAAGSLAALLSNCFLGQGPWTPWQMLAWGLAGVAAGGLGKVIDRPDRCLLAALVGLWGYVFGVIMDAWHWLAFIYPQTWSTFWATWAAGFWFDTAHAAGNVVLALAFGPACLDVFRRFRARLRASYEVTAGPNSESR